MSPPRNIKSLKVAELKAELSARGLDTKGLKKDLAERLQAFLDADAEGGSAAAGAAESAEAEEAGAETPAAAAADADAVGGGTDTGEPTHAFEDAAQATTQNIITTTITSPPPTVAPTMPTDGATAPGRVMDRPPTPPRPATPPPAPAKSPTPAAAPAAPEDISMTPPRPGTPPPTTPPLLSSVTTAEPPSSAATEADADTESMAVDRPPTPPPPSDTPPAASEEILPLPPSLSHLSCPPSSILYISNLRRPLQFSDLHTLLSPSAELPLASTSTSTSTFTTRSPFTSADYPGIWLSGVKSHAYAAYSSATAALSAAEELDGKVWPDGVTGAALGVQFVDPAQAGHLIAREEAAWADGRRRLALVVNKKGDNAADARSGWEFDLVPFGVGGLARGRPGYGLASRLTGVAPRPPATGNGDHGQGLPYERPGAGAANGPPAARVMPSGRGALRYTRTRPTLAWREGPGARR